MKPTPDSLYLQLRDLVAAFPKLDDGGWALPETRMWLGRVHGLIDAAGEFTEAISFRVAMDNLGGIGHIRSSSNIANITYRVLAKAELSASSALQGQFIGAGEALKALAAIAQIFARARTDLLLIDAYADNVIVTDFAVTAPSAVNVRILASDKEGRKSLLRPAVERWHQQFGTARKLEVRVAPAASLHDRLIVVDAKETWHAGQSFNGMADRSHTSVSRDDPELAAQKIAAYGALWDAAKPL